MLIRYGTREHESAIKSSTLTHSHAHLKRHNCSFCYKIFWDPFIIKIVAVPKHLIYHFNSHIFAIESTSMSILQESKWTKKKVIVVSFPLSRVSFKKGTPSPSERHKKMQIFLHFFSLSITHHTHMSDLILTLLFFVFADHLVNISQQANFVTHVKQLQHSPRPWNNFFAIISFK